MKSIISYYDLEKIKKETTRVFREIGSSSYKQKLVYKLLTLTKGNKQTEFFSNLLKVLNSNTENPSVKTLTEKLRDIYPLSENNFEKVSYAIIMSIMASIENKEEKEV